MQFFTRSCVRVVTSTRAGMGKSLYITRMAEHLQKLNVEGAVIETIPIHGPQVTTDTVMECLDAYQDSSSCTILHFDIAPSVRMLESLENVFLHRAVPSGGGAGGPSQAATKHTQM